MAGPATLASAPGAVPRRARARVGDRRTARAVHYAMVAPTVALLLAFLALPALYIGWLSLTVSTNGQPARFV